LRFQSARRRVGPEAVRLDGVGDRIDELWRLPTQDFSRQLGAAHVVRAATLALSDVVKQRRSDDHTEVGALAGAQPTRQGCHAQDVIEVMADARLFVQATGFILGDRQE
jgi:hypothetical protein